MPLSISEYLERGPATSKEIQANTGLSQAAVSRQLRGMKDRVITLKNGRSPRYVITRNAFGADDKLPLIMVDAHGNNTAIAVIRPLAHGGFYIEPLAGMPDVLLGDSNDGLYDDLPYFLIDLTPQGFLGRQIALEIASQADEFPPDPRNWSTNHIGRYLVSNGDDLPGNFRFGQQAHLRIRRKPVVTTPDDYPDLADSVINGVIPGSSAGGEQPKFTAFCGDHSAHVIVKFSPKGTDPVARRWRDILITEFHATEAIHSKGLPAAKTRIIDEGDRLFLESQRFDRTGEYGRMSMLSLQYIDAEFAGLANDWPHVMDALFKRKMVSWQHVYDAEYLHGFGRLINNTDMHLGNLSLSIEGNIFRILPVYDMCSMGFAPMGGEVLPYEFTPSIYHGLNITAGNINEIKSMAHDFWERVTADYRISNELKEFLQKGNPVDLMK